MKHAFLNAIKPRKEQLFGQFSASFTKVDKDNAWKEVYNELAASFEKVPPVQSLRNSHWQNLQGRAKGKIDKAKSTGTGTVKLR